MARCTEMSPRRKLKFLEAAAFEGAHKHDPIRFYRLPVIGRLYRRRIELCLSELTGGERILEVGYGSGVAFPNLSDLYDEIHGVDLASEHEVISRRFADRGIDARLTTGDLLDLQYEDRLFDSVLLISILEHLRPRQLSTAFEQLQRVLKPGGQIVYGVPVERPFMVLMYRLLGYNIRDHHFSTEVDVAHAAEGAAKCVRRVALRTLFGKVYEVGHYVVPAQESGRRQNSKK